MILYIYLMPGINISWLGRIRKKVYLLRIGK